MKSVLVFSAVTFALIFGGVAVMTLELSERTGSGPELTPGDYAASERILRDAAVERDRIQQEREQLAGLRQAYAVQEQMLVRAHEQLREVVQAIDQRQQLYVQEREESVVKLAKMYEAMKPQHAAPILSALELDIVLEILSRMKERPAARILSYMDAGLAAQISTRMSLTGGGE